MCFFQRRKFKTREMYSEIAKKNYNKPKCHSEYKDNIKEDNIKEDNIKEDNIKEDDIKNKE